LTIKRSAIAGTLESSDLLVEVFPGERGVEIELESAVIVQFGDSIRQTILETTKGLDIEDVRIHVVDRGALDCTIRARVETALLRAKGECAI